MSLGWLRGRGVCEDGLSFGCGVWCMCEVVPMVSERVQRLGGWVEVFRWLSVVLLVVVWGVVSWWRQPSDGLGTDFYPLYRAGRALLAGENPYGAALTAHFVQVWHVPYAAAGFAYPLPAVVGVWPIVLLPLPVAIVVWVVVGVVGVVGAIGLQAQWRVLVWLPWCFLPLHGAVIMKQATLVWCALVVVMLFAMRGRRAGLVGLCVALLPAKPQVGLFFALAGVVWGWREGRSALVWMVGWVVVVWGGCFVVFPGWVGEWLASVVRYNQVVYGPSLLPWGLVLLVATWRLPWYARLGAAQVVFFPVIDVYSALPLLLTWVGVGGPLALVGSVVSWVGVVVGLPNSIVSFWALILVPVIGCAGLRFYQGVRGFGEGGSPMVTRL